MSITPAARNSGVINQTPSIPADPPKASRPWDTGVFKTPMIAAVPALGSPADANDPSDCSAAGTCARPFWVAPAGEAAAWLTAAAWVPVPAGLVVCGGGLNG